MNLTKSELIEISDAITATLGRHLGGENILHEQRYGTLTLLHEAQAKILPEAFGFSMEDTVWGPERAKRIADLRVQMGLPEVPTAAERSGWR